MELSIEYLPETACPTSSADVEIPETPTLLAIDTIRADQSIETLRKRTRTEVSPETSSCAKSPCQSLINSPIASSSSNNLSQRVLHIPVESNSQELGDLTLNVANVSSSPGVLSDLTMCIEENSGLQTERIFELGETGRKSVPSYSATYSLVCTNIDTTMTNIFSTPLINGPASDY